MEPEDIAAELKEDSQLVSSWLIYYRERKGADRVSSPIVSDLDMKWLEIADVVRRMLGPKKLLLLELRQREADQPITQSGRGRPGWLAWIQRQWAEEYARQSGGPEDECWISDGMIKNMWSEIVTRFLILAAKRGLLNK
jgi:hypothetical protein